MHLKLLSAKCQPFCLGFSLLKQYTRINYSSYPTCNDLELISTLLALCEGNCDWQFYLPRSIGQWNMLSPVMWCHCNATCCLSSVLGAILLQGVQPVLWHGSSPRLSDLCSGCSRRQQSPPVEGKWTTHFMGTSSWLHRFDSCKFWCKFWSVVSKIAV